MAVNKGPAMLFVGALAITIRNFIFLSSWAFKMVAHLAVDLF